MTTTKTLTAEEKIIEEFLDNENIFKERRYSSSLNDPLMMGKLLSPDEWKEELLKILKSHRKEHKSMITYDTHSPDWEDDKSKRTLVAIRNGKIIHSQEIFDKKVIRECEFSPYSELLLEGHVQEYGEKFVTPKIK